MNKKNIIIATLMLTFLNWAPFIWADSCNSKAEYFTAVEPFNIDMSQAEGSSFSSALCGQDVSVTSISGEPINIASIATLIRPDGSVVYAEDVTIKVGDKEVFAGNDFTEEDLDRLLLELGAEVESEATIAQVQQVNRQTYNTISTRLMNVMSRSFIVQTDTESTNKMAASADNITSADNDLAIWSEVSYAKIKDDNQSIQFSTDLVQVVSGLDKRFGNLIIGSALTYSHADNQQTNRDYSSNNVGITPYIAYKVTDYMFLSGLLGYNSRLICSSYKG
ncbi:autotransporter domain-containing protein [Methyloprofundus sp.]|uniref:autotransporter domain-containing protein n=1 Tax=Methyloprofundus sp. TaxID=2020875 RepID=UPI003D0FA39A